MEMNVSFPGGKQVAVEFDGLTVLTDQPPAAGGEGSAASPLALFLASLAACAGYYVLAFCQGRGIPTEGIRLVQRAERDPEGKLFKRVDIALTLPGSFPDKYREAVVKSAEQCAVKKHLQDPPEINVKIVE